MKALTFQGVGAISCETVDDPNIESTGDVIVRVESTAICGSDLHPYAGRERGIDAGTVMGHEFAGTIVEVGKDVKDFVIDDRVVSPFTTSCGRCYFCSRGLHARCVQGQLFGWREDGRGLHGAQAEYVRVPLADGTLVKYGDDLSSESALLAGDILSTGLYCADRAEVKPDGIYAVIGCGPVGLMTIMACLSLGVREIFAFDSIPERLDRVTRLGVTAVNYRTEDPLEMVMNATGGIGVDAVMEAVGSQPAGRLAYEIVRPGGTISTVGVHTDGKLDFTPMEAYDKNLTYRVGRCPARAYMDRSLALLSGQAISFDSIITHRLSITDGEQAYKMFSNKEEGCLKVILKP